MQHFFVEPNQIDGRKIYIEGSDVNHIKNVLRMKPGEKIYVSDGNNRQYLCSIILYEESKVVLEIQKEEKSDLELPSDIYLFQGLPKNDKMDLIVQKSVELGVHQIIPVKTRRCVVKLDNKKEVKKTARWNEIAKSAAKQAGRGIVPEVLMPVEYDQALKLAEKLDVIMIPYELAEKMDDTRKFIEGIEPGQSIGFFIGPEGGFEKEEIKKAVEVGAKEITLGKRILRTETAGLMVLSILVYNLENR